MAADVSAFVYFLPIFAFLIVFALMFAVLAKTQFLGENKFFQLMFAFIIATIFVTASSARQVVLNVIPWFAVLIIAMLLLLTMINFMNKGDMITKTAGFGWLFIILLIIIFFVSGVKVFSSTLGPYLPGALQTETSNADPTLLNFFDWLYSPRVAGFFLIAIVAAIVSWVLVKTGGMGAVKK